MQIRKLTAYVIRVPLRKPFRHASAVRRHSDNLFIRCELTDGIVGWGEGVPRSYVTGETPAGALDMLTATPVAEQLGPEFHDWPSAMALSRRFVPVQSEPDDRSCRGNALRCAVELAILDACGQLLNEPLSRVVDHLPAARGIRQDTESIHYSTTIDADGSQRLWRSALKMRLYGFHQCKVKVGASDGNDRARLATVRRWIGPHVDLRIDANCAWQPDNVVERVAALKPYGVTAVEQPLAHEDLPALAEVRASLGVPVMLDESLTSMHDAQRAVELQACDLFNLRLSKCGGLIRTVELAAFARRHGLGYQLGCHPGETGLLSAAGRHFATSIGGIRYCEGSYDRHVLARRLTHEDHTFGYTGRAAAIRTPGLGATLDLSRVEDLVVDQRQFAIAC